MTTDGAGRGRTPIQFVMDSTVRENTLLELEETTRSTREIVSALDGSESSIYAAVSALSERGLLVRRGDELWLTGSGRIVVRSIKRRRRTERVLDVDGPYWERHETGALPEWALDDLGSLASCRVLRAPKTDPNRVRRRLRERLDAADSVDVVTTVYEPEYAESVQPSAEARSRFVLSEDVAGAAAGQLSEPLAESAEFRVANVSFSLAVTEQAVFLSLPTLEGAYDPTTEIVAESTAALEWGSDLFERYWEAGRPFVPAAD